MDTNRLPKQALQCKRKGRRNIGRPRKRWRDQLHLEDQGTGNTPNPSGTWSRWWRWWSRNSACVYRFEQSTLLARMWEVQGSKIGAKSGYSVDCFVTLPTVPRKMSQQCDLNKCGLFTSKHNGMAYIKIVLPSLSNATNTSFHIRSV